MTADNRLLSAAEGLPIHIVGSQYLTEAMDEFHPDARKGDAFLHNDPYHGNTHHADHTILAPVFSGGEHVFTAVAKAHQADCGNGQPTTYAAYAKDIYEEGALNFPCVRIQEDYEHVDDVIRMCRSRIRVPDQWYGDYLATLGAARIGERRLEDLVAKLAWRPSAASATPGSTTPSASWSASCGSCRRRGWSARDATIPFPGSSPTGSPCGSTSRSIPSGR